MQTTGQVECKWVVKSVQLGTFDQCDGATHWCGSNCLISMAICVGNRVSASLTVSSVARLGENCTGTKAGRVVGV